MLLRAVDDGVEVAIRVIDVVVVVDGVVKGADDVVKVGEGVSEVGRSSGVGYGGPPVCSLSVTELALQGPLRTFIEAAGLALRSASKYVRPTHSRSLSMSFTFTGTFPCSLPYSGTVWGSCPGIMMALDPHAGSLSRSFTLSGSRMGTFSHSGSASCLSGLACSAICTSRVLPHRRARGLAAP